MNLASILDDKSDAAAALISRGRVTTYGNLRAQAAAMRGALVERGVQRGDTVVLLCGNSRYFVVSYLATIGLGAVAVPLNPASPAPEIAREITAVSPRVAVVEPAAESAWKGLPESVRASVSHVIATEGHGLVGAVDIETLLVHQPAAIVDVDGSTPAVYVFTSGTAGAPKAAVLSHGNLASNIAQVRAAGEIGGRDVVLGLLPLFHIFGLNVVLGCALDAGACVVLIQRFDPVTLAETVAERGITVMPGAPAMWSALAQLDVPPGTFDSVRLALSGAAKLPETVARRIDEVFGMKIYEGYGLTEASPVVSTGIGADWKPGSIGHPVPGVTVRVVDENGDDALCGDSGELWVRGPNVFLGYLDDPEATARVLVDGWLHTGDVGVAEEDGSLYLVDRAKDLIIVSGFNVFPAEVESVLRAHPDIVDAAVAGVAHPHTGESPRAWVVVAPGRHLDEDAVIEHCRANMARYKCPTKVLFVDELPRNVSGKVLRRSLT